MSFAARILISLALLAFIGFQVDWAQAGAGLRRAEWAWLVVSFLTCNAAIIMASLRWQLIVNAAAGTQVRVATGAALTATYVSLWLSNFLPTAFGGDIARVAAARRAGAPWPVAVGGSLLDRYLGLVSIAAVFVCSEALTFLLAGKSDFLLPAGLLAVGFGASLAALFAGARVALPRKWLRSSWLRFFVRIMVGVGALSGDPRVLGGTALVSAAAALLGLATYWGVTNCVVAGIPFGPAIAAGAIGALASALPISLSGWGVREGAVLAVLHQAGGLSPSDAGLVAILAGGIIGATSLIGLVLSVAVKPSAV